MRNVARIAVHSPWHPVLVAAYPVLFLFAHNIEEQVTLQPLWVPLGSAVGGTALVFAGLTLLLRDVLRAALLTSLATALFFGYGHAWTQTRAWMSSEWTLLAAWVLIALFGSMLILRSGRWLRPATGMLTLVALVAVTLNAWTIGAHAATSGGLVDRQHPGGDAGMGLDSDRRPDVYYLVFDRYAGLAALANEYGFDNTPFVEQLRDRGFYVATESHANYPKTPLSLVSVLSMGYLDGEELAAEADAGGDRTPIHARMRGELAVPRAFKELGYAYVHVASWWEPSATNVDADRVFRYEGQTQFAAALRQTTLLRLISEPISSPPEPRDWEVLREHSLYELERLEEIPQLAGPKYVFGHVLLPHDPYVFDIDGSFTGRGLVSERGQAESYLRQLQYLNRRIIGIVDAILEASDEPPVIIIQADEGPFPERYRADERAFDWRQATDAELEEKFGILNAFHLPGVEPEAAGLHPTISSVNTFRVVLNSVFGADLPLLADRIFTHVDLDHFYEFVEITDRLE